VLDYHPELRGPIEAVRAAAASLPALPRGDAHGRRARLDVAFRARSEAAGVPHAVDVDGAQVRRPDASAMAVRTYRPRGRRPARAVLYLHGGGMIACSLDTHDAVCRRYAVAGDITVVAVDYRLAPEHPHPAPLEDAYLGLQWLAENADLMGVDPSRIACAGDSGGGGIAAGLALLARDRGGPPLAGQILIYPMLDDRTTEPDPSLSHLATWTYADNATGWEALLGAAAGGSDVSPYAAPARARDLQGLPRTYIEVGSLDIFRDENVDYAARLLRDGVDVELHVHAGANHAFELYAPESSLAARAQADRARALAAL
jgi:acetyl esterase/lipase